MNTAIDWTPETEEAALAEYKRTHAAALPDAADEWIAAHPEIAYANALTNAETIGEIAGKWFGPKILKWDVKCEECKVTIRETTDVHESYAGGTCDNCKLYQVGQIISHSWGYEQTNIDFFRIVRRSGDWVTIRPMTAVEKSNGPTSMTGTVVPGELTDAKPFRRKLRYGTHATQKGQPIGFPIKSYGWASLWDGQPEHVSHYG